MILGIQNPGIGIGWRSGQPINLHPSNPLTLIFQKSLNSNSNNPYNIYTVHWLLSIHTYNMFCYQCGVSLGKTYPNYCFNCRAALHTHEPETKVSLLRQMEEIKNEMHEIKQKVVMTHENTQVLLQRTEVIL